jgi:hypothetical protein
MEIGFWGWVAVGAAVVFLFIGVIVSLKRRATERRMIRLGQHLKSHLKRVPIRGTREGRPDPNED